MHGHCRIRKQEVVKIKQEMQPPYGKTTELISAQLTSTTSKKNGKGP
jgi:hypothetical protein